MKIYLAARYSRREELCHYRYQLESLGHVVQSRWLDGKHQIDAIGKPIGDNGEALIEGDDASHALLRAKFAQDDWEDVTGAEMVINFTEPPGTDARRGGRHVECGIGMALGAKMVVVGYRENIFHWLPQISFYPCWDMALLFIGRAPQTAILSQV